MISKILGTNRFNYIDVGSITLTAGLFNQGSYVSGVAVAVIGAIISVIVSGRAERQTRKSTPHNTELD